ncbi:zinc finger protein 26-like [Paramacrobiotus metropolitanus]|uniref:zinc finger protein 26-like n=1 Tax=Paramacrobiotus metropolitanus TaxID=2943436 RepID=UPI0024460DB3|nr:zinc finger protein 26-like [Paramacrobiotus metropolitanus]XP_055334324.1 zinc finger protein 26-like [Paramacrobiotus metropolitanus]
MDNLASDFINFDVSSTANRDFAMDFTPVVPCRTYDGSSECPDDKGVSDSEILNDCLSRDEECLVQANVEATEASECTVFDTENAAFLGRTATASPVSNLDNDDALSEMCVRHLDDGSDLPLTVSLEADSGETVDWNQDSLKTKKHLQSRKKGKCLVCGRYFKYLVSHLNTTHTEEDVRAVDDACFLCHRKFQSHKGFGVHLKMAHRRVPPLDETARLAALDYIQRTGCLHYRCADCRKVFTSEALLNIHAFAHDTDGSRHEEQPERKCPGCTFTGPTFAELLEHTGQHSRTLGKQHQCILCGMLVDSLIRHADAQHPEVRQILQEKWSFECSECSQTFIDMVRLKVHMNKSHQRTRCLYCGFRGPTMNALIKHVKQHRVDRLFPCQWCGISYKKYDALVVHVRESHSDVLNQLTEEHTETVGNDYTTAAAPESATLTEFIEHKQETSMFSYYCDSCHLHFPIKALWDLHKIHHYSDSKELDQRPERRCPACDFEAACFADLMHHSKEHGLSPTDKKPCAVCGGHFRYLKRHFRTQHPEILQRLEENWEFVCDECGERFKSENNLNFHIKTVHVGGFQCLYCAKLFRSLLELGLHARPEHSVNGEYPCLSCDKKFGSYSLARQHYRERHDVMQMKTCEICQDVCRGKKQLAEHMESVHDVQTKVNKSKIGKKESDHRYPI